MLLEAAFQKEKHHEQGCKVRFFGHWVDHTWFRRVQSGAVVVGTSGPNIVMWLTPGEYTLEIAPRGAAWTADYTVTAEERIGRPVGLERD